MFFWMQEPDKDGDAERCKKVDDAINNRQSGAADGTQPANSAAAAASSSRPATGASAAAASGRGAYGANRGQAGAGMQQNQATALMDIMNQYA